MICSGDGVVEQGRSCPNCNGSGEIEAEFGMTQGHYMAMFDMFVELKEWCTTVNQKLAYLKEKIDAL